MSSALLLNAGAGWAAYQMGAIEHLAVRARYEFDQVVGCGIGAMNGAFVACGEVAALGSFWDRIATWRLVRPSPRPWRALTVNTPQRRFVERHVSEQALCDRGVTFALTTFDLWTGEECVHRYPGDPVPIVDAIMAAVATPGLARPLADGDRLLAEATMIDSVPFAALEPADDVVAVLAGGGPLDGGPARCYSTWRAVAERSLEINLARDSRRLIDRFADDAAWDASARSVLRDLAAVGDVEIDAVLDEISSALVTRGETPRFTAISPSAPLGYPLWRFPRRATRRACELGRLDAAEAIP